MSRRNKAQARRGRVDKALSPTTMQFAVAQPRGLAPRQFALMDAINTATARLSASGVAGVFEPLPRDALDTTAFGPLNPLSPDPIDPVRRDTHRPEPRVFEYQNGWNLPGAGGRETPWQVLRAAADGVSIIRTCLEVRKRHIRSLAWEIAPAKEAVTAAYQADQTRSQDSIEADMRSRLLPDINRLREFLKKPWHSNDWRLGQWINAVVEDMLVLDGAAIYPRMNYGGQVLDLEVLDAATIKLLLDWRGARPQPPYAAFQQILYGFPRGEWTASTTRDEQGNEVVENGFAAGELFYYRENVRSFTPYGYPPVERALMDSRLWLKRFGWLLAEYDDGSTPLTFLETAQAPDGTRLDVTQRRLYEEAINDELMGQTGRRHRMKVLPADWKPHQMTTAPERYRPDYDLFIIKLIAANFGVTIAELGFTDSGAGLGAAGWHEGQAEVSGRVGLRPDVEVLSDLINSVAREFLRMSPELEFRFIDPAGQNDKDSDGVADAQVKSGRITLNDDRRRLGLSLYDFEEADMPMIVTATGPVFLEGSFQRAQEAAEAAKEQQLAGAEGVRGKLEIEGAKLEDGQKAREETLELERERMDRAEASNAQKMAELGAFRTWRRRNPEPKRPFVFKAITPDDGFPDLEGLTPDVVDFGPDWDFFIDDLEKGVMTWLEWNAKNPMRPRGPDGRWVKRGGASGLPDALRLEGERTARLPDIGPSSSMGVMEKRPIKRNDMVEWTPGGLARVDSDPFKKYGKEHVKIFPFKTGASSDEGRYTREWPVDQLALADMKQWEYDANRNAYRQRPDEPTSPKPRPKTSAEGMSKRESEVSRIAASNSRDARETIERLRAAPHRFAAQLLLEDLSREQVSAIQNVLGVEYRGRSKFDKVKSILDVVHPREKLDIHPLTGLVRQLERALEMSDEPKPRRKTDAEDRAREMAHTFEGEIQAEASREQALARLEGMSTTEIKALSDTLGRGRITDDMTPEAARAALVTSIRGRAPRRKTSAEKDAEARAVKMRGEQMRAAADLAMDIDELLNNEASDRAIRSRLGERSKYDGLRGEALREAVWGDAEALGMQRVGGEQGETVLRPGAKVTETGQVYRPASVIPAPDTRREQAEEHEAPVRADETPEQARFREMDVKFRKENAQDQVLAGVKQAKQVVDLAQESGFVARVRHATDSGDSPYMVIDLAHPGTGEQYSLTWHTRGTDSYRLFSKSGNEPDIGKPGYHDVPSVKYVMNRLRTANERAPAAEQRAAEREAFAKAQTEEYLRHPFGSYPRPHNDRAPSSRDGEKVIIRAQGKEEHGTIVGAVGGMRGAGNSFLVVQHDDGTYQTYDARVVKREITGKAAAPDDFEGSAPDLEGDADPKAQAPIPPDQRWPGWAVDTAIAAAVAPMLMAGVNAGMRLGALAKLLKDWLGSLGLHAGDPVPDARAVRSWLVTGTDIKDQMFEELIPPIRQAHIEGWMVGQHSADALMDWVQEHQENPRNAVELSLNWGEWEPGHPEAARLLIEPGGLGRLLAQSNVQIKNIVDHRLDEIGRIIGQGLQRGASPQEIAKDLGQVGGAHWAKMTALTETNRAMSAASVESYRRGGCWGKGWMTAYDQRVCPICKLNEEMPDGSPRVVSIDEPFPSGDPWPPGHPWCRCAVVPVFELTRGF